MTDSPANSRAAAELDVCLSNGRSYVQATQMLARVGELLEPEGTVLMQAKFVRLTRRAIYALAGDLPGNGLDIVGSVQFGRGRERFDYSLLERDHDAPSQDRAPRASITSMVQDGALSGRFAFTCMPAFEGVLEALVQGIKSMHAALGPATTDIWFTGLRGMAMPLDLPGFGGRGVAEVTRLRLISTPPRHQSLMNVTLHLEGVALPIAGQVTFAFNPGPAHVD